MFTSTLDSLDLVVNPLLSQDYLQLDMDALQHALIWNPQHSERPFAVFAARLKQLRDELSTADWREVVQQVHQHPLFQILLTDPFTRHSYQRPHGYPGDAELLDYIYGHPASADAMQQATALGRGICQYGVSRPAPQAVRSRRNMVAQELQRMAAADTPASVLSVACGRLREAEQAGSESVKRLARLVAYDQDPNSLAVVRSTHPGDVVEPVQGDVMRLLRPAMRQSLGHFDFVYSAGLYDYLSDRLAMRLTAALLSLCKPGGRLWLFNFAPNISDIGYMEAVMDWWLIYRDERQMGDLARSLNEADVQDWRTWRDTTRNIVALEIVRR